MANKIQTTETLRETLFETLEKITTDQIEAKDANVICNIADKIIKTAELEIKFAGVQSRLDKDEQGLNIGRLALTSDK